MRPHPIKSLVRFGLAATLTAVLVTTLVDVVLLPSAATAAGPSVPLPGTPSTPVTQQQTTTRPQDQASRDALKDDQAPKSTKDGAGNSTATSLSPSGTWQVSAQTGDFTWSYPLRVPPGPGGAQPKLALSYASSSVDGRTSATNNQASWIGDGWDLSPGFIERTYGGCSEDDMGGTTPPKTGDLCWRSDNAIASYDGGGGQLIRNANGDWRAKSDDGSRIERLTGAGNGDNDGEHWKITAVNGTQYFFGSDGASKSAWTVPVFGDDAGEPCHAASFDNSHCTQVWRWNLNKVVDRNGNVTRYSYDTETNSYGLNLKDAAVSYVRGGTLKTIEYGLREDDAAVPATGRVEFTTADRCVPGSDCTPDKKDNWPDVAWDDKCDTATCKDRYAPTFWSTKRLAKITTKVRNGSTYEDADSWTLDQQYPNPGDGEKAALWLKSVTHTGHVGGSQALPPVTFEGTKMPNRVYKVADGYAPLNRYRITGIVSESGGVTSVKYADPDCTADSLPAKPEANTKRCFPARWAKKDHAERTDHFQKYVVEQVTQSDRISSNPEQVTSYEYLDGAAWHYDQSEFSKDDKKTWNEFRGFGRVRTRTGKAGDPSGPVGLTEQRYYRGMHGDKQPSGTRTVSVPDSEGGSKEDSDWLQGQTRETLEYNRDTVESKTISTPTWQGPTATRGALKAYVVRSGDSQSYTRLAADGWRITRTESTYDDRGVLLTTNDLGDTSTAADDRCTKRSFARNTERWLLNLPYRTETVAVQCDATPTFPADAISDTRTSFDDQAPGVAPVRGNPTKGEELEARPAAGPDYVTTSTAKYDTTGRPIETADALGRTTKAAYTPATGGPVTQTVNTNVLGHVTTSTLEPATGLPLKVVDPNKRLTESAYDPLGRATEVWLPNRNRADGQQGNNRFSYLIRTDGPAVVKVTALGPNGNYRTSHTLYDGLMRLRQVQAPATGGGRLLTDTRYDSQGRAYKSTQPYFNDAAIDEKLWVANDTELTGFTRTEFDGAGRGTAEITYGGAQEKWRTTTAYGGDRVHVTPPAGGTASTTITDARGQTVELRQYRGGAPTGAYDTTAYTYTKAGRLASTTDPAGNAWRNTYDLRGNETKVEDADKGTSVLTYDALGQVVTSTDARGTDLTYGYDLLGRKTWVKSGATVLAQWTYDTADKGKGHPASATRYVGGAAYTSKVLAYTALDKPSGTTVTIPEAEETLAGSYTSYAKFNPDGSPYAEDLPEIGDLPAETVNHQYNDLGLPTTTSGGPDGAATAEYVTATEYTRYGEVARRQLGDTDKRVWQSYYYDEHSRRLDRTIVDAEVARPMQADVHYDYDPFGNITSVADTPREQPADRQCFRYDHQRRLTEAWTPGSNCDADPSTGALAGPAPYWQSFSYDVVGNRLTETQHAVAGDTVRKYTYPTPGAHALKSVATTNSAGTKTDEFSYDGTGNTTRRGLASGAQTLDWDAQGKLAKVTEGAKVTEFVYDPDGNRLIRRDPTGSTLYLDGQELRLEKATGKLSGTRYYRHGETTVALRTAAGLTWLASDHQGTAQLAVDSASLKVTQRRQAPFGAPRGAAADFPGEKGFVGGTIDVSTGLTNLGARAYDTLLGRFISVDPMMDLTDPQQMHGYGYSNNNPITHSDPTGLFWKEMWEDAKKVAKFAAPILGAVAIVAVGLAAVVTAPAALTIIGGFAAFAAVGGLAAGAINTVSACSGGGSGVDCGMEIAGMIPIVGRVGQGARTVIQRGAKVLEERSLAKTIANSGTRRNQRWADARVSRAEEALGNTEKHPLTWLDDPWLGKPGQAFDYTAGAANVAWGACGIQAPEGTNCMGLPSIGANTQPIGVNNKNPFVPTRKVVYPPGFIGPIPRGAVRGAGPVYVPKPAAPPAPAPNPGRNYTTSDGRLCNTRGGMCAI